MAEHEMKISVRNLVEFILQSGDLDNRRKGPSSKDAMLLGGKIHRKIQRRMGSNYQAEYPLCITVPFEEYSVTVEGRADGVLKEKDRVTIDEIKGTYMDLEGLEEPVGVHLAQAMCYAYLYANIEKLEEIRVQMTYCHLETERLKYFTIDFSYKKLEHWFHNLMEEYKKWADFQNQWRKVRKLSIKNVDFPFEYRQGQRDFVTGVYRTILRKKNLFVQAPTGVGKTISTIFPAVKAVGEDLGDKIFYLTAKTITRTVAQEAYDVLKKEGLRFKVLTLTAKEKMCLCDEVDCNPDHCEYAKGHYDRVNDAVFEMLNHSDSFTRESIIEGAHQYRVCPFELSLDLSTWVDGIICDYNYVFDPNVKLKRFFSEGASGEYLFLVDEAHNLVERAREMYSAVLYKEEFLKVKKAVKPYSHTLEKALEKCNHSLLLLKRECEKYVILSDMGHFVIQLMNLLGEMERFLEYAEDGEVKKMVSDFFLEVRNFLNIYDRVDENYVIYTELTTDHQFLIKLYCMNTGKNLQECLDTGNSTIFFSATLLPVPYYKSLFSKESEDYAIYIESPFTKDQSLLLIGKDVSSKYTRRNQSEYEKMSAYIEKVVASKTGNYIVFFPSYQLMEEVYHIFSTSAINENITCMIQTKGMREQDREEFLEEFSWERGSSMVAFCVLGGIFSEGIDLIGNQLIGTIIVGTGLPQISNEREILKNYYDGRGKNGFEYSLLYPGMNKVLQAAGRVIRTVTDKGVILLLDDRFLTSQYRNLFPREWDHWEACSLMDISKKLEDFWHKDQR